MVVYYSNHAKDVNVHYIDMNVIDWLEYIHFNMTPPEKDVTELSDDEVNTIKKSDVKGLFCSGFETQNDPTNIQTPDELIPRKESKAARPVRDFVAIDYDDFEDKKQADELPDRVKQIFGDYNYAVYPSISYPKKPRYRFVLEVEPTLNYRNYHYVVREIMDLIGFEAGDESNEQYNHLMNAPYYFSQDTKDIAVFNKTGQAYDVSEILDSMTEDDKKTKSSKRTVNEPKPVNNSIKSNTLSDALENFLENENVVDNLNNSYEYFWRFTESVAMAIINGTITETFGSEMMTRVAMGNQEWEEKNQEELMQQVEKLESDPSRQRLVQPITSFLPIVEQFDNVKNLPQLLKKMLPETFMPNSDLKPHEVSREISRLFEFALLPSKGKSDAENVAIFNPLTGAWEHDENQFLAMITVIKPGVTKIQFQTIMMEWGANARFDDKIIKPYNKSRYLLFKNGVLDVKTFNLHSFSDPIVRECNFTKRHRMTIDWNPNPKTKIFKQDRLDEGDWDIHTFINGYGHFDKDITEYFLFGLSLGLFAGHNTSVHFDIQGSSRFGKTTLALIFENLFNGRIAKIPYSNLNQQFPVTNYDPDTAIIWVNENNVGAEKLNDEFGTPFYDGLADNETRIPVKHGSDIIVNDPPQVFIDGTQFIQAKEIHTGPAGRTLAYKLPDLDKEELTKIYSIAISSKLEDEEVLQDLVYHMLLAFKSIVPDHRIDDFKMNLSMKRDIDLLPPIAKEWRREFVSANTKIKRWFEEEFEPYIILDKPLHDDMTYDLYVSYIARNSKTGRDKTYAVNQQNFEDNLDTLYEEFGYQKEFVGSIDKSRPNQKPRKKVGDPKKTGFDWKLYEEGYIIPDTLKSANTKPELFGKRVPGWYKLEKLKEKTTNNE